MTKKLFQKAILLCALVAGAVLEAPAQTVIDSLGTRIDSATKKEAAIDSVMNRHSPHKASLRSAILPGWGQAYNRSYWKLPIIYGALGTTAYIFTYNLKTYKELKFAYAARYKAGLPVYNPANPGTGPYRDSTDFFKLMPIYQNPNIDPNQIKFQRDEFRRNVDYSVLVFAVFWALNVVDAAVDAHLKSFDVSPDLSLRFKAGYSDMARTNGFGIVLSIK